MATSIRRVDYFSTTVRDEPGEAFGLLQRLAELGINLLAFAGSSTGPASTQLTLFPEDTAQLAEAALRAGIHLHGPHPAILVQGDDKLGALAEIHEKLFQADVNVLASSGVTDGRGSFGYVLYVRPEQLPQACSALGI